MCWLLDLCTAREVIGLSGEGVQCSREDSVRRTGHAGRFYTRLASCHRAIPPDIEVLEKLVQDPKTISEGPVNLNVFAW